MLTKLEKEDRKKNLEDLRKVRNIFLFSVICSFVANGISLEALFVIPYVFSGILFLWIFLFTITYGEI